MIRVMPGTPPKLSVVDLVMIVCQTDNNQAGQILRRISDEEEVPSNWSNFKFA